MYFLFTGRWAFWGGGGELNSGSFRYTPFRCNAKTLTESPEYHF